MTYNEKLKELSLFSLGKQWGKGGMLRVFKHIIGFLKEDSDQLFSVSTASRTRGNGLNLQWEEFKVRYKKFF